MDGVEIGAHEALRRTGVADLAGGAVLARDLDHVRLRRRLERRLQAGLRLVEPAVQEPGGAEVVVHPPLLQPRVDSRHDRVAADGGPVVLVDDGIVRRHCHEAEEGEPGGQEDDDHRRGSAQEQHSAPTAQPVAPAARVLVPVPVVVLALVHSDGACVTARLLLAHAPGAEALGGGCGAGPGGGGADPGRGVRRARCTAAHRTPSPRAVRRRSARSARISATSSQIARADAAMPSGQVR